MNRSTIRDPAQRRTARRASGVEHQLDAAASQCAERGTQLTPLRRSVLRLLLQRGGTAKAYDLQDDMRIAQGRAAPMTVYRALDFLIEMGLVHRVDSLNTFVVCSQHEHGHDHPRDALLLACTRCGSVSEARLADPTGSLGQEVERQFGFRPEVIEVKGLCGNCQIGPR